MSKVDASRPNVAAKVAGSNPKVAGSRRMNKGGMAWCNASPESGDEETAEARKLRKNYCQMMSDRDGLRIGKGKKIMVNRIRDSPDGNVTWKSGFQVRGDLKVGVELTAKKLCIGDLCIHRDELVRAMKKGGMRVPRGRKLLDHMSPPDEYPHTYMDYRRLCETKGKRLCQRKEVCDLHGRPKMYVPNDMIRHDHWVAVGDDVNEWVTFSPKTPCQTWRELHQVTPSWGHHTAKDRHYRGVMCCSLGGRKEKGVPPAK